MRGARELFHEYISELHGGTERNFLVGCDGGMHVIAGEYCQIINKNICYLMAVPGEVNDVSHS